MRRCPPPHGPSPAAPVNVEFYTDSFTVPGVTMNGRTATSAKVPSWPWIGNSGYNAQCVATNPLNPGGLIGLTPSGARAAG